MEVDAQHDKTRAKGVCGVMTKEVFWTDKKGIKHRSVLQDWQERCDQGYIQDPPDVFELDWEQVKIDLHNQLVNNKLFTYQDVINAQNGLTSAVIAALKKKVKVLYREAR